jgi:hypothetical protein
MVQHFADEPDDTRPRNPWPRLLALGAVLLLIFVGFSTCLVIFVNTGAEPELRLQLDELDPGLPRFEPVTPWGADPQRFTYGAWIVHTADLGTQAFFSRNVGSTCNVQWLPAQQAAGATGVFRDRCDGSTFAIDGTPIDGPAPRHLDQFEVQFELDEVIVNVRSISIGACLQPMATGVICSGNGPITRTVPLTGSIPAEFGRR